MVIEDPGCARYRMRYDFWDRSVNSDGSWNLSKDTRIQSMTNDLRIDISTRENSMLESEISNTVNGVDYE